MNKKANEQFKSNEKQILDVFIKVLEDKDIQKITVKEICEYAHVNRSTFYNHFTDIYDVLERILLMHSENMDKIFKNHDHAKNSRENLRWIMEYIKENELFYRVSFHSPIYTKLAEGLDILFRYHEMKSEDLKDEYRLQFFKQGILSIIIYWLDHDCDLEIEQVLDIIEEFYPNM